MELRWHSDKKQKNYFLEFDVHDSLLFIVDDDGDYVCSVAQFYKNHDTGMNKLYVYRDIPEEIAESVGLDIDDHGQLVVEKMYI